MTDTPLRLIARLDIKGDWLIKGINLEGIRRVGDPAERARDYYTQGIDEILFMDTVASLYGRSHIVQVLRRTAAEVFVPLTVGGGVRSAGDAQKLIRSGADKVAVNSAAVERPQLLGDISREFGRQAVVLSIEALRRSDTHWEVMTNHGRQATGLDCVAWAIEAQRLGAGEILVTSVDRDGTKQGFDLDLMKAINTAVPCPVIASGGLGVPSDIAELLSATDVGAVAVGTALHFEQYQVSDLRAVVPTSRQARRR